MEATVIIPPLSFQDFSIDVQIRIYQYGARYGADIFAMGQVRRVLLEMSPNDLVELNKQLQGAIKNIAIEYADKENLTVQRRKEQLRALAEVGNYAYRRIFSYRDGIDVIQHLQLTGQKVSSIEIAAEDFFLPWELLYPVSLNTPLSYEHFWGMNYVISRVIIQSGCSGAFVSPVISIVARPKLGLLINSTLSAVIETEIPFFEKLDSDGKVHLLRLRNLDPKPEKKPEEFEEFKGFWLHALDLAHFACHACYDDQQPSKSYILLSDEFPITLMDLDVYEITIDGHPLIIMNTCETGNLNPLYTSYFAAAFLKHGARGIVATECAVPDAFAADFARQLYTHLLAGKPLGESLLTARRYFHNKHHNPSGLLYSMYAPPSVRLEKVKNE